MTWVCVWKKTWIYIYDINSFNSMNFMYDKKVNSIADCNLLHDILNPSKHTKNINSHYPPILHVCNITKNWGTNSPPVIYYQDYVCTKYFVVLISTYFCYSTGTLNNFIKCIYQKINFLCNLEHAEGWRFKVFCLHATCHITL